MHEALVRASGGDCPQTGSGIAALGRLLMAGEYLVRGHSVSTFSIILYISTQTISLSGNKKKTHRLINTHKAICCCSWFWGQVVNSLPQREQSLPSPVCRSEYREQERQVVRSRRFH